MHPQQLTLDLDYNPPLTREAFIETDTNTQALSLIESWPQWPLPTVSVYGPSGCGKTHLGRIWQQKSQAYWLKPSNLTEDLLFNQLPQHENFVLEDAQHIQDEEKLFHFYNAVKAQKGSILALSECPPSQWNVKLPDLKSRLKTFMTVAIQPPDENALKAVIYKLFHDRALQVQPAVIDYILRRIDRSFDHAHRLVHLLDHLSLVYRRPLTIPFVSMLWKQVDALTRQED